MLQQLEVWQRGPLPDITPLLQPVGHALLQAREEIEMYMKEFPEALLWLRPAGLASVGFHLQHLSGVLDRVFTYARGESLTPDQFKALDQEGKDSAGGYTVDQLVSEFSRQVDVAMEQLRNTREEQLTQYRGIGRAGLPSTVIGLLVHGAEHTMRHLGQLLVTSRILLANERTGPIL
jgi:uncharacterized damage-inducible protein DinB